MTADNEIDAPIEETHPPETIPPKPKSRSALSLLAILLSVVAIAGSAFVWMQLQSLESAEPVALESPPHSHDELSAALDDLRQNLSSDQDNLKALERTQGGMERRFDEIDAFGDRLRSMEQSLENLQGVSDSARQTWVLAEALYYLQSANTRLQLARDVPTALLALRAADDRLTALGDPSLYRVRELLADEIVSLESVPSRDLAGMALQLQSLGERVAGLPIDNPLPTLDEQQQIQSSDTPESGVDRAVSKVWGSVKGLVTVRRTDEGITPLMSQEDETLLRRNLELQLQIARLSLLQGKQEEFRTSLKAAREWLNQYFEIENPAVRNTIDRITEMESTEIRPALPDISGSLKALRSIQSNAQ
ncbi:MAG: uroporphyrinogen-III C-methyltransferase [Pseudomonadota bacterium]